MALWRKFLTAGHLEASTTEQYYNLEEFVHQKSKIILESLNNSKQSSDIPTKFERTLISVEILWEILTAENC